MKKSKDKKNVESGTAKTGPESDLGPCAARIYRMIRRGMEEGEFAPGSPLPTEMELSHRFGASRSSVRKALKALQADGRIFSRQGSGSYVSDVSGGVTQRIVSLMHHGDLEAIRWIQNRLLERDCIMSLFSQREQGWSVELERVFLAQVLEQRHLALFAECTPIQPTNAELLRRIQEAGTRVIHVEPFRVQLPDEEYFMPDYERSGYFGVQQLHASGYRQIVLVTVETEPPFARLFENGYVKACDDFGIHRRILKNVKDGSESCKDLISSGPTGFLVATSPLAGILYEHFQSIGISVPDHAGILGLELMGDDLNQQPGTDTISFDRLRNWGEIIVGITESPDSVVRMLVPPHMIRVGTLRTAGIWAIRETRKKKIMMQRNVVSEERHE